MKQKLKASEYVLFAGIALLSLFYGIKTTVLSQDRDKLILLAADLLALGSALLRGRYSLKQLGTYGLFALFRHYEELQHFDHLRLRRCLCGGRRR